MQLLWYEMAKIFWICPIGGVIERIPVDIIFQTFHIPHDDCLNSAPVLEPQSVPRRYNSPWTQLLISYSATAATNVM